MDTYRSFMVRPDMLSHAGEAETKNGLACGVIFRDITRDVRLTEFCLSAPLECFVDDFGITRRLVRRYMCGRLPEQILFDEFRRGVQSADWIWRLKDRWDDYYADVTRVCQSPAVLKYADETLVKSALDRFRSPPDEDGKPDLMKLLYVYTVGLFLENK